MLVQACLNGARPRGFHPRLPLDPAALAADAAAAVRAGAGDLHLHVRDWSGRETLAPEIVADTLRRVRAAAPGTLVGISTGQWIEQDDDRRLDQIGRWTELPDHASVNLGEPGAPAVIERLHRRGVAVEAGLASAADAERLLGLGLASLSLRYLIEISEQDPSAARAVTGEILAVLGAAAIRRPILLHGESATAWDFVTSAAREGFSTRIGLEDTDRLPDGGIAPDNAALVAAAVGIFQRTHSDAPR